MNGHVGQPGTKISKTMRSLDANWSMRIVLVIACLSGCFVLFNAVAGEPGPVIPKGQGEHCVADTDYMRRNHMDLLTHQRDDTVIRGIRGEPFSLVDCVDCHVQKNDAGQHVRIDAEGQFCQSCHTYAAVKIDCFGCHAAIPDQASVDLNLKGTDPNSALLSIEATQHYLAVLLETSSVESTHLSINRSTDRSTHLSNFATYRHQINGRNGLKLPRD